jgi:hypothetical protein
MALSVASVASAQVPSQWTFRIVASEPNADFGAIAVPAGSQISGSTPSIDEDGSAICRWSGLFDGSNGLIRYDAATMTSAVVITDPAADNDTTSDFDIRNRRIALRWFDSTVRVYDINGSELFRYTPSGGPLGTYSSPGRFTLTDSGAIGMIATFASVRSLYIDENATPPRVQTLVAQQTSPITFLAAQFMNQNRQFGGPAFEGSTFTVKRFEAGQPAVTLFTTAVETGYNNVANQSDINDLGHVAFFARRIDPSSSDGVTWELRKGTGANTSVLLVDDNNGELVPQDFINFNPDIANNGLVAFRARSINGTSVFMTDGATTRRVAGAFDLIDTNLGSFLITAVPGGVSQNEANQLAFLADLSNGATVLLVATPVPPPCPADFNNSGGVTLQDIFDFLSAYFAGLPTADFNGVGGITVQDIFDFLSAYFAGC